MLCECLKEISSKQSEFVLDPVVGKSNDEVDNDEGDVHGGETHARQLLDSLLKLLVRGMQPLLVVSLPEKCSFLCYSFILALTFYGVLCEMTTLRKNMYPTWQQFLSSRPYG